MVGDMWPDWSIPFVDTIIMPEPGKILSMGIYVKPTQTDQYLQWECHHHLVAEYSVINILTHEAKVVCSTSELLITEWQHDVLHRYKCATRALKRMQNKNYTPKRQNTRDNNHTEAPKKNRGHIVFPYTEGLCESIKKICRKHGMQACFKVVEYKEHLSNTKE